jgi:hypothetical protein
MLRPLQGGTTKPWLALVDDGDALPKLYVVKLFHEKDYQHANHIAAEVMGSILCRQFDIQTPSFGLLNMNRATYGNCPPDLQERLRKDTYPQPWFGSTSMLPAMEFSAALHDRYLTMEEVANIFAFDCLLHNSDRRHGKPNLLMIKDHIVAIDHDRALAAHRPTTNNVGIYASGHLFYDRVRHHYRTDGQGIFDTFAESLRLLDLREWNAALDHLEQLERPFVHRNEWQHYLLTHKQNPSRFVNTLCDLVK